MIGFFRDRATAKVYDDVAELGYKIVEIDSDGNPK